MSGLQVLFGAWESADIGYGDVAANIALSGVGNLLGEILLITLTHTVQVKG